jgi:hypothetical protein
MGGIRIGLEDVLALHEERLEAAVGSGVEHIGDAQARFWIDRHAPGLPEELARRRVGNMAVAGKLVREAPHVAGALDIVLAPERVHAHALATDIAGRHRKVGDRHHGRRALAVLGYAEAVIDRAIAAGRVEPRGGAQVGGGNAGQEFGRLRRTRGIGDE